MLPIKKVLAPTDFSDISVETIACASELTAHFGAEMIVAHVIPPIPTLPSDPHYNFEVPAYQDALRENAYRQLTDAINKQVGDQVKATPYVSYGDPAKEIVRISGDENVDLVVIATHGLTGWQHIVFGSVAERIVRTSKCPVITIRACKGDS
jgi:nucleotide-binding universal stress UspA family protein